jgi:hypothetical protein
MPSFDRYKSEHLFLLVGGNPLPNYVAAKLLAKTGTVNQKPRIHLVRSADTKKEAQRLKQVLGADDYIFDEEDNDIIVNPSKQSSIENEIKKRLDIILKDKPTRIGLNYTGGTKAMAAHCYLAIMQACAKSNVTQIFSYVDPRELKLRVDGSDEDFPLDDPLDQHFDAVKISPRRLLNLHGLKTTKVPQEEIRYEAANLVRAIWSEFKFNSRNWNRFRLHICDLLKEADRATRDADQLQKDQRMDEYLRTKQCSVIGLPELASSLLRLNIIEKDQILFSRLTAEESTKALCDYLVGKWLEDYVLEIMNELKQTCLLSDCVSSVKIEHPTDKKLEYFEVDDVALRGYQLFAVTCAYSSSNKKAYYKQKIFEGLLRAIQLGGSEARVGLVCVANTKTVRLLELELHDPRVRVWGRNDVLNRDQLKKNLGRWFNRK